MNKALPSLPTDYRRRPTYRTHDVHCGRDYGQTRAATEPQQNYINTLLEQREVPDTWRDRIAAYRTAGLDSTKASEIIDRLKGLPWRERSIPAQRVPQAESVAPAVTVDIPAGYYALGDKTDPRRYRIDRPDTGRWAGRVFVAWMNEHGSWIKVFDRTQRDVILAGIAEDVDRAQRLFAEVTGCCWACNTDLTDPISVYNAIGPTCAKNRGIIRVKPPVDEAEPVRVVSIAQLALPAAPAAFDDQVWDALMRAREAAEDRAVYAAKAAAEDAGYALNR
jgi:hypothetical protein